MGYVGAAGCDIERGRSVKYYLLLNHTFFVSLKTSIRIVGFSHYVVLGETEDVFTTSHHGTTLGLNEEATDFVFFNILDFFNVLFELVCKILLLHICSNRTTLDRKTDNNENQSEPYESL